MRSLLASSDPVGHTLDSWVIHLYGYDIHLDAIPGFQMLGISKFVVMMLCAAALLLFVGIKAGGEAKRASAEGRPARGLGATMEIMVQFIRDEVMKPAMPHHYKGPFFISFFCSIFFFILFCNLIGLAPPPFGSTATGGNYSVTGALAFGGTLVMIFGAGIKEKGLIGFFKGIVPGGVPLPLWPILFVIEFIGIFVKPFALMIRLAANMTAGHVILAVMMSFLTASLSVVVAALVWPAAAFGFFAITVFEIAIAFIQAYIFTALSAVFVGQSLSHDH